MRYAGQAVLVTGGATGIGRATAMAFAREGAAVVIGDVNPAAESTASDIRAGGGRATFQPTDVTDERQCVALVATCIDTYGRLDAAFNNAGVLAAMVPLHEATLSDYERTMAVNARGVFLCMKAQIRHMLSVGGGAIVNTASVGAVIANPNMAAYVASKHAVAGLTKAAALEYARQGIRVNAICPGFVQTAMTRPWLDDADFLKTFLAASPIGRPALPEEISGMVLHLCSAEASFTNGSIILMDGGQTTI
jgi:NAD(P)-dependent dehydrogenase (short-subunit alcohol dehydrogenase family)